tara:strand:+ start:1052 stop:1234 length:183 start_codon:yes stop_codon:yes gene_type:complete
VNCSILNQVILELQIVVNQMVVVGGGVDQLLGMLMPEMSVAMRDLFVVELFGQSVTTVSN